MNKFTMVMLVSVLLLVFLGIVVVAVYIAPIFTSSLLGISAMSLSYILTERWKTHDAVEFENRFWSSIAGFLAVACAFTRDSPIRLPSDQPILSWTIVFVFTFLAHNYERHLRRLNLSKVPNIKRIQSAEFASEHRVNAKHKLAELRRLLSSIDQRWLSSTFQNMFLLPRVVYIENKIIAIFAEANTDELNLIMMSIELGLILYKVKDHRMSRQLNRTKLLHTLVNDRVGEMNISSRAMLLDGLQRMKLSAHHLSEVYVKQIIMKTKGDELSELKSHTDNKGDINSMHKLIYVDIRNEKIKKDILKYISEQARIQASHSTLGTRVGRRRGQYAWRKILSDVDDTLSCSGGSWPAGIDTSYPKKAIYPGVIAFYKELDLGIVGGDEWDNSRLGNLVFLSARPHVYKDVSENVTYQKLRRLQVTRGLHTSPSLLAGSLDTGGQFMVKGDTEPLAMKKFENFCEYLTLYPEFSCIFIGDNGQGDVRTAEMVLSDARYRGNLKRIYIHEVQPLYMTYAKNDKTKTREFERICYFNTYVDAAIDAHKHKLIRSSGLRRVMEAALKDFEYIPLSAWTLEPSQEIPERAIPPFHPQTPPSASAPGAPTPLSNREISRKFANAVQRRNHAKSRLFGEESKRERRVRELNRSLSKGNAVLSREGFGSVSLLKFTARFAVGSPVVTLFGNGIVTRFRPADGIYEVSIQWDTTGEKPPVKAYLTGAALLSPVPPLPMTAATIGPGTVLKNVPALRTAVAVVKVSSLPKPVPAVSKLKSPSPAVRGTPPSSPMIMPIPPPAVPLISLQIIPEESDGAAAHRDRDSAHNTHSDGSAQSIESVQSDSAQAHTQDSNVTVNPREGREGKSKVLPLPLPLPLPLVLPPVTGTQSPSRTHPQPQPLWTKGDYLTSDKTPLPNPFGSSFNESNVSSVAVLWPLDPHTLPPDLCDPVGGAEERFEIPWGQKNDEESVPECAEKDLNSSGKGEDKDKDKDRDRDDDVVPVRSGSLSTTRHLSFPLFSSKDRDLDPGFRSTSHRSLGDSDDLKTVRIYSRTQSLLILGSESLDEKLRRRLSAVEFPIGKIVAKSKAKEKLNTNEKGKGRVEVRDKEKEIEEILKERLVGVRGSRAWTPYGLGVITNYRSKDDKVEVLLEWGGTCYLHRDSVVQITDPTQTISYIRIVRKIIEDEERVKDEERAQAEKILQQQQELENQLKQRLAALKQFEESKIAMEKSMTAILNKRLLSPAERTVSPPYLDSSISPERRKRMSILPAISRALSPLHIMRLDSQSQFHLNKNTHTNDADDDLILVGKNLDSVSLKDMISGVNDETSQKSYTSLGGSRFRGKVPGVSSPGGVRSPEEGTGKTTSSSTSMSSAPSIFSRGWMHWPSQTFSTSSSTSNSVSINTNEIKSKIVSDGSLPGDQNASIDVDKDSYDNLNGMYVQTPYGPGYIRKMRISMSADMRSGSQESAPSTPPPKKYYPDKSALSSFTSMPNLSPIVCRVTESLGDGVNTQAEQTGQVSRVEEVTVKRTDHSGVRVLGAEAHGGLKSSLSNTGTHRTDSVAFSTDTAPLELKVNVRTTAPPATVTAIIEVDLVATCRTADSSGDRTWGRAFLSPDTVTVMPLNHPAPSLNIAPSSSSSSCLFSPEISVVLGSPMTPADDTQSEGFLSCSSSLPALTSDLLTPLSPTLPSDDRDIPSPTSLSSAPPLPLHNSHNSPYPAPLPPLISSLHPSAPPLQMTTSPPPVPQFISIPIPTTATATGPLTSTNSAFRRVGSLPDDDPGSNIPGPPISNRSLSGSSEIIINPDADREPVLLEQYVPFKDLLASCHEKYEREYEKQHRALDTQGQAADSPFSTLQASSKSFSSANVRASYMSSYFTSSIFDILSFRSAHLYPSSPSAALSAEKTPEKPSMKQSDSGHTSSDKSSANTLHPQHPIKDAQNPLSVGADQAASTPPAPSVQSGLTTGRSHFLYGSVDRIEGMRREESQECVQTVLDSTHIATKNESRKLEERSRAVGIREFRVQLEVEIDRGVDYRCHVIPSLSASSRSKDLSTRGI